MDKFTAFTNASGVAVANATFYGFIFVLILMSFLFFFHNKILGKNIPSNIELVRRRYDDLYFVRDDLLSFNVYATDNYFFK